MEKQYVLKTGNFYLSKYYLDSEKVETSFIAGVLFVVNIETALKLTLESIKHLDRILYINTGIDFEIVEV